ncbi:hypothetical protein D9M73_260180 [compost metagenome]
MLVTLLCKVALADLWICYEALANAEGILSGARKTKLRFSGRRRKLTTDFQCNAADCSAPAVFLLSQLATAGSSCGARVSRTQAW